MYNRVPWCKSITFNILIIVNLLVIGGTILFTQLASKRIIVYFDQRNTADLQLAATMGIQHCEDRFEELLHLRLSDDQPMVQSMRADALNSLRQLPEEFAFVEIVVVENGNQLVLSTLEEAEIDPGLYNLPKKFPDETPVYRLDNGLQIKWVYFPFWRWHIIAAISAENAFVPIAFVQHTIFYILLGILVVFSLSLALVFNRRLRRPLKRMALTADEIKNGRMLKTGIKQRDEIGIVAEAFDEMVDGLSGSMTKLKETAEQKNLLLMEVHHRVRNNLNVIISLLNLRAAAVSDNEEIEKAFEDSKNRIMTMAMIHGQLYDSGDFGSLDINVFFSDLTGMIKGIYDLSDRIKIEYRLDPGRLELDRAVTLGLLVNEILTNAFKYAFPDEQEGCIYISFRFLEEVSVLEISDNGIGAEPDVLTGEGGASLGMKLIHQLVIQLQGNIEIDSARGVAIKISFPL
ncbi:MAG: histidine kinase dimerization/phosphoacceptor domain -containing protein [Spirochaetales bacterium]|uniref:histidine kinase n=1 Tax=Candidatus Thalassospirochaeta sargassi TaxID=3119039 RepID=A0AAJ1IFF5_9SPIO|nr:histidine kinase dimerization/phosphoacceptor domain -containing protein [Spirochaetales bacterium]